MQTRQCSLNAMISNRRNFLKKTAASSMLLMLNKSLYVSGKPVAHREFTMHLDGGAIGIEAGQMELINLAHQYGFESVTAFPKFLVSLSSGEMEDLSGNMQEKGLVWANAGLPVEFRKGKDVLEEGIKALPALAKGLQQAGVMRMGTWVMPNHSELNYLQNFRQHVIRLREIAGILKDHNIRLGLEYVGPKTLWTANNFPFVHTMAETQELIAAIGQPNVGLLLDSFHWYTAGENAEDIRNLSNQDIVACDLNDARPNLQRNEQIDGKRMLPMSTRVIDTKSFLEALMDVGYDGPIRAEPFNEKLNKLTDEDAVAETSKSMKKAFDLLN